MGSRPPEPAAYYRCGPVSIQRYTKIKNNKIIMIICHYVFMYPTYLVPCHALPSPGSASMTEILLSKARLRSRSVSLLHSSPTSFGHRQPHPSPLWPRLQDTTGRHSLCRRLISSLPYDPLTSSVILTLSRRNSPPQQTASTLLHGCRLRSIRTGNAP